MGSSFRRSDERHAGCERWCREHRATLARWLPQAVIDSPRSVGYVLLHGDDELGTGWTPQWLTPAEAAEFLAFLEPQLSDHAGYDVLRCLRRRAAARAGPGTEDTAG